MADPVPILSPDQQNQLSQLLALATNRASGEVPLHNAALAMATRMAPGYAQAAMGSAPTGSPSLGGSSSPVGSPSSSGPPLGLTTAAAFFAALAKNPAALSAFKNLIGGGGPSPGNPDFMGPVNQAYNPNFMGPQQASPSGFQFPANAPANFDPNMLDPNGYLNKNPGSDYAPAGGTGGSMFNRDGQQGSAADTGFF